MCVGGGTGGRRTFQKEAGGGQRWATVPQQPSLAPAHVCAHELLGDGLSFSRAGQGDASGKGPFWFLRPEELLPLVLNQGPVPGQAAVAGSVELEGLCGGVRWVGRTGAGSSEGIESCWGRKRLSDERVSSPSPRKLGATEGLQGSSLGSGVWV